MRYLSVCSGLGGAELAFAPLGWECAAVCEIEPSACSVLKARFPNVPNFGDFTKIGVEDVGSIDLLVGGTPCQSFSVAGLRGGLGDDRGNLALEFLRLADRTRPRWILWENVPGVYSATSHIAPDSCPPSDDVEDIDGFSDGEEIVVEDEYDADENHAFSCFLAGLSELRYEYAYRTLDARYFGVPQRRRRVFVIANLGNGNRARAVLFEQNCLSWNSPTSRKERQGASSSFTPSSHGGYSSGVGTLRSNGGDLGGGSETLLSDWPAEVTQTLDSHFGDKQGLEDQHIRGGQASLSHAVTCHHAKGGDPTTDNYVVTGGFFDVANTLNTQRRGYNVEATYIPFQNTGQGWWSEDDVAGTVRTPEGSDSLKATVIAFSNVSDGSSARNATDISDPLTCRHGDPGMIAFDTTQVTSKTNRSNPQIGDPCHTLAKGSDAPAIAFSLQGGGKTSQNSQGSTIKKDCSFTLNTTDVHAVAFSTSSLDSPSDDGQTPPIKASMNGQGTGSGPSVFASVGMQVRRLVPVECARLQGVPDDYLDVLHNGKPLADGNKYRLLGNGFAVPVVAWIGRRIQMVEDMF